MKFNNPIISLKYLVFKYNVHQIADALNLATDIGVDIFHGSLCRWTPRRNHPNKCRKEKTADPNTDKSCLQLWRTIVLNSDGGIAPCCFLYFKEDDFTDMRDIADATLNQRHTQARMMFDKLAASDRAPELPTPLSKMQFRPQTATFEGVFGY